MPVQIIKPPTKLPNPWINSTVPKSIFLAGSIEMGKAANWQDQVSNSIINTYGKEEIDYWIFNPRRDHWDSSWEQSINNPQFVEQVNWELDALDFSEYIFMYFDPNTKSPISMLELGLHVNSNLIVCCPDGFWRKGNIEIVCQRHSIKFFTNFDEAVDHLLGVL